MRHVHPRAPLALLVSLLGTLLALPACTSPLSGEVGDVRLADAGRDTANWLLHGRTHDEQRFSPLAQVTADNVGALGLVWSRELDTTRGLEATPIVVDGVLYTTGAWSVVYAIDAGTGTVRWEYDPQVPRSRARVLCCDAINRGVAFYRGKVYVGTLDGRLIALDATSGVPVWETATVDASKPYSITGAPRIAKGMIIVGNGGAEMGVRGYVSAYDAADGHLVWRTYTVPGDPALGFESDAMKRAAATWTGRWWEAGGGGTAWDAMLYDPDLDLIYVGTGNGSPWYRALRSPGGGDNLYLSSILALRPRDGEIVWHFQTTPGDNWDYTATQPLMLADLTIEGRLRKVIMQAPKNGFFYVLDRETGAFISGKAFADVTWATGLDPTTGRPLEAPTAAPGMDAALISPDPTGAHNWHPMAFNPDEGLVYLPVRKGTAFLHRPDKDWQPAHSSPGIDVRYRGPLMAAWAAAPPPVGQLVAWDPVRQEARWAVTLPVVDGGGVLATAGQLVMQGRADGRLLAYHATDGRVLWEFDAGTGIMAPPVTYLVDGVQHITVMVGWGGADGLINQPGFGPVKPGYARILTFALAGAATLDVPRFGHAEPPVPAIPSSASAEIVEHGRVAYDRHCFRCHGVAAVAGSLPDLRYSTAAVHAQYDAIVLGGARQALGMPAFGDVLTLEDVRALQAYVLARAAAPSPRTR